MTDLFRERLDNMLNQRHALYRLADLMEWSVFDNKFGSLYCPDNGCPGKPTRLMVGLQYLKHVYGLLSEYCHHEQEQLRGGGYGLAGQSV